jgi:phosphatidylglycerophosphatase A
LPVTAGRVFAPYKTRTARFFWTFFYTGRMPIAPGTVASGVAALAAIFLALAWPWEGFQVQWAYLILAVGLGGLGSALAGACVRATGREDPGEFVLDEASGMFLAVLSWLPVGAAAWSPLKAVGRWTAEGVTPRVLTPWTPPAMLGDWPLAAPFIHVGLAFAFFRMFDIVKPPPVRQLEKLPGAAGIMADDWAAGLMAAAATLLVEVFVLGW